MFFPRLKTALFGLALISLISSCNKAPETDFTYEPTDNPEAGMPISFTNTTENGSSFDWTFGDGGFSSVENPVHIFESAGEYNVKLTATNDAGEQAKTKILTITEPTNLSFYIFDSDTNLLTGADVWLYDNEADWDDFEEPLEAMLTDNEGKVVFSNLKPMVYYIWAIKEDTGGLWISGGWTPAIAQNENNIFDVPCVWLPDDAKKSTRPRVEPVRLKLR